MDDGMTALHHAAFMGHDNIIEFFLELGQDINSPDKYGRTPLALALVKKHEDTAKLLLKKGATTVSIVLGVVTPLRIAVSHRLKEIALLLLRAGADANAEGIGGMTPLHLTTDLLHSQPAIEMIELILGHGGSKYLLTILERLREQLAIMRCDPDYCCKLAGVGSTSHVGGSPFGGVGTTSPVDWSPASYKGRAVLTEIIKQLEKVGTEFQRVLLKNPPLFTPSI
ncbi:uncharacterized protein LAJ45_03032 [Morchella importuna]|uniref:uncharacterized protein n=1 Tax=Morchella importuna TaxID=1174673 RepID=UPI001E8D97FB|nr:uncharacterized protein LAJ45_03032 [Morchella importuna]KAH8152806.1 hypothetical protein LAJ45_03032 [Morchella importuna]